jgi:hypothetical protein
MRLHAQLVKTLAAILSQIRHVVNPQRSAEKQLRSYGRAAIAFKVTALGATRYFVPSARGSREVRQQQNHNDFRVSLCDFYSNRLMIGKHGPKEIALAVFPS